MRKSFVLLSLLAFFSLGAGNKPESVIYNLTPAGTWGLLDGAVSQIGGKQVQFQSEIQPGMQVHFEDLMPTANWRHPAKLRLVSANGNIVEEIATDLPPQNLSQAAVISGAMPNHAPATFTINDFKGAYKVSNPEKHYAFLFNGHADQRHWNDFSFLYRVLTQIYGYNPSNIIVADGSFQGKSPDLDGNGTPDIQYSSNLNDLKTIMADLASRLKPSDDLIFAVNDHGGSTGGESTIILYDTEIKASEFAKMFKQIRARKIISIYEQCFSGGFVRPSVGPKRVAMAAAHNNEYSWASKDLLFDEFIYHVIAGFAMQNHRGEPVVSDLNRDNKISAQEAFAYAVGQDRAAESPIMESHTNSGDAALYGLGF